MSSTFVAIKSSHMTPYCHLSCILHRFRNTASQSRKPPHPSLSPRSRDPSNFAVELTMLKVKTLRYFYKKKPRDPDVLSQYTRKKKERKKESAMI